ncbi:hypothetical protein PR202_ga24483 [Eleusine coracana subsp. coracana]|uniref:Uncharacterized protein n=1 Tax=Eleusine coracana subsp. coracana TaxID=191504 RepID=A0AAV5D900_ELECO|nr:hypothetical protein PR202_ga24483 [Eleusine coracana subsp. coracana]
MAVVGGMLASALLKVVTQQICAAIGGQIKLHLNFENDLKKMKMALESVEAVLKDAERRSIQDASVRLWLRRLTDAVYGISDMFDEFEADTKLAAMVPFLAIGPKICMAMRMKKMRQKLENITNQHQSFSFKTDNSSNFQAIPDERETDSYVEDETLIVGRTEEKRKIIALFSASMTQDDLWEESDSQLNELVNMLPVIKGGNVVVIVTTRDERIARKICTVEPHKLLPLSDEMCWAIIKRKSDFQARDDKEHLEQVGKDIAMKCGGVALAAQTLGYMLKPLTFREWESVRSSDIWNISTLEDESHKIVEDDLIYQWIAHDFIVPSAMFSARQLGKNYVTHFLGMSFLQYSKSSSVRY